jgi:hypothetical protein
LEWLWGKFQRHVLNVALLVGSFDDLEQFSGAPDAQLFTRHCRRLDCLKEFVHDQLVEEKSVRIERLGRTAARENVACRHLIFRATMFRTSRVKRKCIFSFERQSQHATILAAMWPERNRNGKLFW